jgi:hypothetical protein
MMPNHLLSRMGSREWASRTPSGVVNKVPDIIPKKAGDITTPTELMGSAGLFQPAWRKPNTPAMEIKIPMADEEPTA